MKELQKNHQESEQHELGDVASLRVKDLFDVSGSLSETRESKESYTFLT